MTTLTTRAGKGSPLTHAEMDANLTGLNKAGPAFYVDRNGTDQTAIATATDTKVQFTRKVIDSHSAFDATTNYRFVAPEAGLYVIHFQHRWNLPMGASEHRIGRIFKNGSQVAQGINSGTELTSQTLVVATLLNLALNDYVEFYVNQNSGSNKDLFGAAVATFAFGYRIGSL